MENDSTTIIKLTTNHIKTAAEVLTRAFDDSPISVYIFPDEIQRKKLLNHIFRFSMKLGVKYGEVFANSPQLEGIAIWMHRVNENKLKGVFRFIRCGAIPLLCRLGISVLKRYSVLKRHNNNENERFAHNKYWLLMILGVDAPLQGKGYGSFLMNVMLKNIDQDGLSVYLGTDKEINVTFYKRFGFKVLKEKKIP
ncbi:unnamed protein product, partial [marine sediment metagenome]